MKTENRGHFIDQREEWDQLFDASLKLTEDTIKERITKLDQGRCPLHDQEMTPVKGSTTSGWFHVECPVCEIMATAGSDHGPYELFPEYQRHVGRDFHHPSVIFPDDVVGEAEQHLN